MDILIVDDETLGRARLRRLLEECRFEIEQIHEASDSEEAWELIQEQDPELVLLDIEMPGENGITLAEKASSLELPPAIIFTTAYDQYALDAFNTVASGYPLKPVQQEKLEQALEQASKNTKLSQANTALTEVTQENEASGRKHITVKGHRGIDLIDLNDIRIFKADQKYVQVISTEHTTLIDETLKELEQEFSMQFVRIHRNALVSIRHILGLERHMDGHFLVRLADTDEKPIISRRYTAAVKQLLVSL